MSKKSKPKPTPPTNRVIKQSSPSIKPKTRTTKK